MDKKDFKDRENLYRLIISQLNHDGYTGLAATLASAANMAQSFPSDRLFSIFVQGLNTELEEKELKPSNIGIDLDYETEAASMAPEPRCYDERFIIPHNAKCRTGAFSNDGQFIATGSKDGCIKVMETDIQKISLLGTLPDICTLNEHKEAVTYLEFHPTEMILVSGSKDSEIKFYDFGVKSTIKTISETSGIKSMSLHPSGQFILVGTQDPIFKLYDLTTLVPYVSDQPDLQHKSPINMMKYSPDAKIFATASKDGDIKLWDGVSSRCFCTFPKAHEGREVCSIQFSRNSKYLLSSAANSPVKLWEISMRRSLVTYMAAGVTGSRNKDSQAVFNHTEDYVLSLDEATTHLCCWNSRTAVVQHRLPLGHKNSVNFLSHSNCSPAFLSCSDDLSAKYWYSESPII